MKDNGLIERYFNNKNAKSGTVSISLNGYFHRNVKRAKLIDSNGESKNFYCKPCNKYELDAEILLPQILPMEIKTAIGLPAHFKTPRGEIVKGVITDDIKCKSKDIQDIVVEAASYEPRIILPYDKDLYEKNKQKSFLSDLQNDRFSNECIRQSILMRAFDVGTFNPDRHFKNFCYELDKDGKPSSLVLFDYGQSGYVYRWAEKGEYGMDILSQDDYHNDFFSSRDIDRATGLIFKKDRAEMIENFKNNEAMHEYMSTKEVADSLKGIDVKATARDIEDTLGYELGKGYVNLVSESLENLTEELSK